MLIGTNEDEFKASTMSVEIQCPKINTNIRDKSCIVVFPRGTSDNRLNRTIVEEIMRNEWKDLFNHVLSFGNMDFSRKWIFHFDTMQNNDRAVAKEIYINNLRVKTVHATKRFNILKIDWVPFWTNLDDLAKIVTNIDGISGQFIDIWSGRGDKILKDSTQVILRFYEVPNVDLSHHNIYTIMMIITAEFFSS